MLGSFVVAARHAVFMLKTADLRVVADGLGVLGQMPNCFACWIDDLGFLQITRKLGLDPVLAFVAFVGGQEVDWSRIDFKNLFFLYRWGTKEVISSAEKFVTKLKRELEAWFVHHKRPLSSIVGCFKSDERLKSLGGASMATWEAFGDECPESSRDGVVVSCLTVVFDHEGD